MSTIKEKFTLPKNYQQCSQNLWSRISQLVSEYEALDLTLGFPDFLPSKEITDTLAEVAKTEYSNSDQSFGLLGQPNLLEALARLYSELLKRTINPQEFITMSTGIQSLHVIITSLVGENDEVIIIEPYFNFYEHMVKIAGGKCRYVPLRISTESETKETLSSSDWTLNFEELEEAFNENTKLFILNTPNNPSGKVFNAEELSMIANLCKKWNVVCLSDEVYEFIVYPPNTHIRIATLPDMWERTITLICPGKTFGVSGWELGVAYSSEELITKLQVVHQTIVRGNNVPIQETFAIMYNREIDKLHKNDSIIHSLPTELNNKRDTVMRLLKNAGMKPILPEGGFFILVDWTPFAQKIEFNSKPGKLKDVQFNEWMIQNMRMAAMPANESFSEDNRHLGEKYIRICFYKKNETFEILERILSPWSTETQQED